MPRHASGFCTRVQPAEARAAILAFAMLACGGGDRSMETVDTAVSQAGQQIDTGSVFTVPPPTGGSATADTVSAPEFPDPVTILAADSIEGQRLYRRATQAGCIACHGTRGGGVPGVGSRLNDQEWILGNGSLSFLYRIIRDGAADTSGTRVPMPALAGELTRTELFQLSAYVYAMSHPGSTLPDSSALVAGAPPVAVPPPDTVPR